MRVVTVIAAATILLLCAQAGAHAQDAVPLEILSRTVFIKQKGSNEGGSAFTVDYKGKLYLVTARHVIEGISRIGAMIESATRRQVGRLSYSENALPVLCRRGYCRVSNR